VKRAAVSGSGIFKDQGSDEKIRELFFAGTIRSWQLVLPGFGTIEGPFQIVALEFSGDHAGEVTFELALESAGAVSFTAS
jgi:TP901-1 family phage major tail protein